MFIRRIASSSLAALVIALTAIPAASGAPSTVDQGWGRSGVASLASPAAPDANILNAGVRAATTAHGTVVVTPRGASPIGATARRFTEAGVIDTTWGTAGAAEMPAGYNVLEVVAAVDGGVRIVGISPRFQLVIYALDQAGRPSATYGSNGLLSTGIRMGPGDAAVDGMGRVLVAGCSLDPAPSEDCDTTIVRAGADGSLDESFGTGGQFRLDRSKADEDGIFSIALQPSGGIVASLWSDGEEDETLLRVTDAGVLDTSFGEAGFVSSDRTGAPVLVAAGPDGRLFVSDFGSFDSRLSVRALTVDGAVDGTFGVGGIARSALFGASFTSAVIRVDGRGRPLLARQQGTDTLVARFTATGRPDAAWGTRGQAYFDPTPLLRSSANDAISDLLIDAAGRVILVIDGVTVDRLVRLVGGDDGGGLLPKVTVTATCGRCIDTAGVLVRVSGAPIGTPVLVRWIGVGAIDALPTSALAVRTARVPTGGAIRLPKLLRSGFGFQRSYLVIARVAGTATTPPAFSVRRVVVRSSATPRRIGPAPATESTG